MVDGFNLRLEASSVPGPSLLKMKSPRRSRAENFDSRRARGKMDGSVHIDLHRMVQGSREWGMYGEAFRHPFFCTDASTAFLVLVDHEATGRWLTPFSECLGHFASKVMLSGPAASVGPAWLSWFDVHVGFLV